MFIKNRLGIGNLLISLFTAGNFWVVTPYPNLYLKLEALGARRRTQSYLLGLSSFSVPSNILQKTFKKTVFYPVAVGKVNFTLSEKLPDYGSNDFIFKSLGVDFLHSKGLYGQDIVVGVFDTGFDSTHPAIQSIYNGDRIIAQYDFSSGDHLILNGREFVLSDSIIYIQGFSMVDSFLIVSYAPVDLLALNDNAYRIVLIHDEEMEVLSINRRAIQPRALHREDTLYIVYEEISSGYMQIYLAQKNPDGSIIKYQITDNLYDNIWPDVSLKNDSLLIYYADPNGIIRTTFHNNTIVKTDTLFLKQNITYLKVYDDKFIVFATYDSVGVIEISNSSVSNILSQKGFNPGLNPKNKCFYFSDSAGTWLYDLDKSSLEFLTTMLLTAPPSFNNDSILLATFNDYSAYKVNYKELSMHYEGLSDLIHAHGSNFLIRQRGDHDVMPDVKNDYNMHGTQMLSIIGGFWEGRITGIAPLAKFVLCKTERGTSPNGNDFENTIEEDFWVEALEFAIKNKANIVSSSLGYKDWYTKSQLDGKYPISSRMASLALSYGVLVVNAMGNETHQFIPEEGDTTLVAPADAYNILAVGGCDTTCSIPVDCSYGPTGDGRIKPELVAPFNAYWVNADGIVYKLSGTSVSTALTSGIIAALWSSKSDMEAIFIRNILLSSATQLSGYSIPNNITGYGCIDAIKAYNALPTKKYLEGDVIFLNPYPNPAKKSLNREITIPLQFVHRGDGVINVLTANGKLVKTLKFYDKGPGILSFNIPIKDLSPGLYLVFFHSTFGNAKTRFIILP